MANYGSHFTHKHAVDENDEDQYKGYTRSQKAAIRAFDKVYSWFPSFLDVFPDEDAFLEFVAYFVLATLVLFFILSRFVTIKPACL